MNKWRSLGKLLTLILRHEPHKFNIKLTQDGFASVNALANAINGIPKFSWVTPKDIVYVARIDDKGRFELKEINGELHIRAIYGHSKDLDVCIEYSLVKVGEIKYLYHGTQRDKLESIIREGIKAMNRKYVHLSATIRDALEVAKRRKGIPVVTIIDAERMLLDGIKIYRATKKVYLVDHVPPKYIVKWLEF